MLYVKDQFGNKLVLNPTFRMVGLPFQRKYETLELSGSDGELQTSEPVMDAVTRTISGTLYGTDIDDVIEQRDNLAEFVIKGKIKVGYENENRYIEGHVVSFDHKYEVGRVLAEVRITVKCDNPFMFGEEIIEEYIVSSNEGRVELENPPAWLNFSPGTFDVDTGERRSSNLGYQSNFEIRNSGGYSGGQYISTVTVGDGFQFDCLGGFSLIGYQSATVRKFKVFIDGIFEEEVTYSGSEGVIKLKEHSFDDSKVHKVIIIHTQNGFFGDYIDIVDSSPQTLQNAGADTYPSIEVESVDTVARFSPLGKIVGVTSHPVKTGYKGHSSPLSQAPSFFMGTEVTQTHYDRFSFFNNSKGAIETSNSGEYACFCLEYSLLADQSPYKTLSPIELQNHIQSIVSSIWAYGEGAIEQGDPSFETSKNGFYTVGTTIEQSTVWSNTGDKSLKIVTNGTNMWANTGKAYGDQHGKKLKVRLSVYNPCGSGDSNNILIKWWDETTGIDLKTRYITLKDGEQVTLELEVDVPSNCTDIWLYIYPSCGVAETRTIYVDDVTVTANRVEVYFWNGNSWGTTPFVSHTYGYPAELKWINTTASIPAYIDDIDGKMYVLIKSKYPSDGINPSKVFLDYCDLETTLNYAKIGTNFLTNEAENILPPFTDSRWTKYPNCEVKIIDDYAIQLKTGQYTNRLQIILHLREGAQYTASIEMDAKRFRFRHYDLDLNFISENIFEESGTYTFVVPVGTLRTDLWLYEYIDTEWYIFKNPMLVQSNQTQHFRPQEKYTCGFSEDVILTEGDILTLDPKVRKVKKNGVSQYPHINADFKFNPLRLIRGLNHLQFNHVGNVKYKIKYLPKWR